MKQKKRLDTEDIFFVSYLKTPEIQGKSLNEQRDLISNTISKFYGTRNPQLLIEYIEEYEDIFKERSALISAIRRCELTGAHLIVATIDELPHSVFYISGMMEVVNLVACDVAVCGVDSSNRFSLHMASIFLQQKRNQAHSEDCSLWHHAMKVLGIKPLF